MTDTTTEVSVESKKGRIPHPLVGSSDGYPFTEVPPDFDSAVHKPLKKMDFATDAAFFDHRANIAEEQAMTYRAKAEEARNSGSKERKTKADRLAKMLEQAAKLRKQLEAQGVDVDELIAQGDD